jgi:hypothetical protein
MELVKSRTGTGLRSGRTLVLFDHDWAQNGLDRWEREFPNNSAGFDLFRFLSNTRLGCSDLQRFVDRRTK